MPGPSTPVLDSLNDTPGITLPAHNANWGNPSGFVPRNCLIHASGTKAAWTGTQSAANYWIPAFAADQEIYGTIPDLPAATTSVGALRLQLRMINPTNGATLQLYEARWDYNSAGADTFKIIKNIANAETQLAIHNAGGFDPAAGDKMRFGVVGTNLTIDVFEGGSWQQVLTWSDSSISGGGNIAFWLNGATTFDDVGGGNISASGPTHIGPYAGKIVMVADMVSEWGTIVRGALRRRRRYMRWWGRY